MADNQSYAQTLVAEYGDYLFSYAFLRVKDEHLAEDLVQETLLAAITSENTFSHRSSIRTWLTGILKHKIIDSFRRQGREVAVADLIKEDDNDRLDDFFQADGRWVDKPVAFPDPESAFEQKEFWEIFRQCLSGLKAKQAEVFLAKEIHGLSSEEVCKDFGLTPTNFWVLMHRARLALGRCLKMHWMSK